MTSLRARVVLLCAMVAMTCTAVCAISAARALAANARVVERRQSEQALAAFDRRLLDVLATLAAEAGVRAQADSPTPPAEGELARLLELGDEPRRLPAADARAFTDQLDRDGRALAQIRDGSAGSSGVAQAGGQPVFFAATGSAGARAIAFAPLSGTLAARLTVDGWGLGVAAPGMAPSDAERAIVERQVDGPGGPIRFMLVGGPSVSRHEFAREQTAIAAAGLGTALAAALAAALLAWIWMRPLRLLVDACRARTRNPSLPLPAVSGPEEASVLREALLALLDSEHAARDHLAQNLERESAVNAVHQRFLAQLAHEFAQPIRALTGTIELLRSQGGRLEPERLAEAHDSALRLEERFQEVLGLAADLVDRAAPQPRLAAARYLADLAAILRPQADRLGVTLQVDAPDDVVEVDARLLSPILVNLAANGMRAAAAGAERRLTLRARVDAGGSRWVVEDGGAGISEPLAGRIAAACARGEVLPAEPGMGLGLALALANARALGGRLALTRNGASGATFELALPPSSAARPSAA